MLLLPPNRTVPMQLSSRSNRRSRKNWVPFVRAWPVMRMLWTSSIASLAAATIASPSCLAKSEVVRSS